MMRDFIGPLSNLWPSKIKMASGTPSPEINILTSISIGSLSQYIKNSNCISTPPTLTPLKILARISGVPLRHRIHFKCSLGLLGLVPWFRNTFPEKWSVCITVFDKIWCLSEILPVTSKKLFSYLSKLGPPSLQRSTHRFHRNK